VKGKLKTNHKFQCSVCTCGVANKAVENNVLLLDNTGQLDCVDRLGYLGGHRGWPSSRRSDRGQSEVRFQQVRGTSSNLDHTRGVVEAER
jgi:hypothetical protein